jgi:hypothetical protein
MILIFSNGLEGSSDNLKESAIDPNKKTKDGCPRPAKQAHTKPRKMRNLSVLSANVNRIVPNDTLGLFLSLLSS